jgi:hypothetical protein
MWTGDSFVQDVLATLLPNLQKRCETVRNTLPLERLLHWRMVVLFTLRTECSLFTLNFVNSSRLLPRELTGEQLEQWLSKVEASHLQAFQPFVTGVQKDKDAVLAGLTLPWSNGPLEGNVNRLKFIKRSMYGQADLNLLKLRVLHHSPKSLERKNKKMQAQQKDPLEISRGRKKNTNFQDTTEMISKVA